MIFSTTLALSVALTLFYEFGAIIGVTSGALLLILASLMGLGFSVRKFKQKISGNKF